MISRVSAAHREIEIKLPFDSAAEAHRRLSGLGARPLRGREFEDNILFDRDRDPLKSEGKALRLRRVAGRAVLTFKAPLPGEFRHKVRAEDETEVDDADVVERILRAIGLEPAWRYQKYRTEFELEGLHACLDETPLGCFVELEGAPETIDRVAAALGFSSEAYIRDSYRGLEERRAAASGRPPGDLIYHEGDDGT